MFWKFADEKSTYSGISVHHPWEFIFEPKHLVLLKCHITIWLVWTQAVGYLFLVLYVYLLLSFVTKATFKNQSAYTIAKNAKILPASGMG